MTNKFRLMLLSIATLGIFSCADKLADDVVQPTHPEDENADGFVSFKITNTNTTTRAAASNGAGGIYNTGTEYEITDDQGANVVFFFKADGTAYGKSYLQLMGTLDDDDHDGAYNEDNGNATEKVYSARIRKSKGGNSTPIKYCVLILNGNPAMLERLADEDLQTVMTKTENTNELGTYKAKNGSLYFTMSNTIYVDGTDLSSSVNGPTEIDPAKHICATWALAQENPITVHVERVVAKFEISFTKDGSPLYDEYNMIVHDEESTEALMARIKEKNEDGESTLTDKKIGWAIRLKGWNVNGTETLTYWIKNLNDGTNFTSEAYPTPTWKNQNFGLWGLTYDDSKFGWNDQSRMRSYWAVDPHYNTNDKLPAGITSIKAMYPEQFRKADDKSLEYADSDPSDKEFDAVKPNLALNYITYGQIDGRIATGTYIYAPENTFGEYDFFETNEDGDKDDYQFINDGYKRTSTHILVAAELLLDGEVTTKPGTPSDKYCYEGVYWDQSVAEKVEGSNDKAVLLEYMVDALLDYYAEPLFKDNEGKQQFYANDEELTNIFELVPATVQGGDGRLMIEFKDGQTLYSKRGNSVLSETELAKWNDAIWAVGTVKHYKEGKMYYYIPITHMVKAEGVAVDEAEDAETVWKWNIGSYGVVRNHWYRVNVNAILKPGIPVDDPDQPIIPNDEPDEPGYAAFEIVIIPWHVIDQDVSFK